jgi:phage tail sheath gpL-like
MSSVVVPQTSFAITSAPQTVTNAPQRVLVIGQKNGGTATAGQLVKEVGSSASDIAALFGSQSMITDMLKRFRKYNTVSRLDAIALDDPTGTKEERKITFGGGNAPANGTFSLAIQNKTDHTMNVSIASGDTPDNVATKVAAAITAQAAKGLLFTAVVNGSNTNEVDITFVHDGTVGNSVTFEIISLAFAGQTAVLSETAAGTGSPDVSNVFDVIGDLRYQTIVWPSEYTKSVVGDFLDSRFNITNDVRDGVALMTETNSAANLKAESLVLNSQSVVLFGNKSASNANYVGGHIFDFNASTSAQVAAYRALRLTPDQNIASLLVNPGTNAFGGPRMAAVPYHNTAMAGLSIVEPDLGFTSSEQLDLNANGVSLLGNNIALTDVIIGDVVTTYLTDSGGSADITFKYLNYVDTSSTIREFYYNNNRKQYSQTVLTEGDLVSGIPMANAGSISAFQTQLYTTLSGPGYGLTQAGSNAIRFFKSNISVTLDLSQGKVDIAMEVPIVSQVRTINGTIQVNFSVPSNS